jgi:hypothetical protein
MRRDEARIETVCIVGVVAQAMVFASWMSKRNGPANSTVCRPELLFREGPNCVFAPKKEKWRPFGAALESTFSTRALV